MNWNDLKVFLAVAEAGSMSGAAKRVGQNHSTIFRRLNQLEEDLDTRLFDRLKTGYQLTTAGERAVILGREAENKILDIERELLGQDMKPSGVVRVTTAPNLARTVLPTAIKILREAYPQIQVEISVGDADYDLNRREADIALRATSAPPEHLVGKRLMELEWGVYGAEGKDGVQLKVLGELATNPLIGADRDLQRIPVFQWLEEKYKDSIVVRASDLSTMAALAKSGVGYALLPSDQLGSELESCFSLPAFSGELWLLTHSDLRNAQRVKVVWEAIGEAVQSVLG